MPFPPGSQPGGGQVRGRLMVVRWGGGLIVRAREARAWRRRPASRQWKLGAAGEFGGRTLKCSLMVDMPVIVRHHFRIEARCASITGMIRHYAEPRRASDL